MIISLAFSGVNLPASGLFRDTPDGGEAGVIAYSIPESAKTNGLNPEKHMNHILTVLSDWFAADPTANIEEMLSRDNQIRQICKPGAQIV